MTTDEELDQLRTEKTALCEALRRKDEELEQAQQAKQDLREGLKQALIATLVAARARESAGGAAGQR
jgi:hypothetical protein